MGKYFLRIFQNTQKISHAYSISFLFIKYLVNKLNKNLTLKYLRLSFQTQLEKTIEFMFNENGWNLKKPKLILSVTGGAKLSLDADYKDRFRKGIFKVVSNARNYFSFLFINFMVL